VLVTNTAGQIRVLEQAWKRAGMDPDVLGYVEAHGTATQVGDRTEIETLKQFFGDNTHPQAFVGSVKSNFGHTIAAAGMIGVIKTALSLHYRKIAPTLHCEEPMEAMFESRFLPPQELIDWDPEKYPLVAGVNSFGFGGINSHAILTAYEPAKNAPPQPRPKLFKGETYMLSAESLELLVTKLETGDYTNTGGNYRLVILDPTEERIQQAIEIVKKDKPWKGRLGIWFSNNPLLSAGGKIVFLFPGFGAELFTETDSLTEYMDFPRIDDLIEDEARLHEEIDFKNEGARAIYWVYFCEELAIRTLDALGVKADIYTGHSLGEWDAARFAGMTEGDLDECRMTIMDIINAEKYTTYPFIAVSGVDEETAEGWCRDIPDLYLTCYNCPSQVLLTGTEESVAILKKKLEEERIFNAVMPLGLGGHTPLAKEWLIPMMGYLNKLKIKKGKADVWSATTLDKIPTKKAAYLEQAQFNMTHPVYFQDLIEKLYNEQDARVFIQIGVGNLTGFVDEILKDKEASAISTNNSVRDAFEQMRHLMAMLFVEGQEADYDFMGVSPFYQTDRSVISLPVSAPLMTDFPELRDVIRNRYGESGPGLSVVGASAADHPLVRMAKENLRDVVETQGQFMELFEKMKPGTTSHPVMQSLLSGEKSGVSDEHPPAALSAASEPEKKTFVENMEILLDDYPYLLDHAIIKQPKDWPYQEDLNPVVPFTMTIELLAEMAKRYAPGRKLIRISGIMAYRFISVERPFNEPVNGKWKTEDTLTLDMSGYVKGDFTFADDYPEPPAEYVGDIPIGEMLNGWEWRPPEYFYKKYAFHGPKYHSATDQLDGCTKGLRVKAEKAQGKGSLLDIMGQQLGLYLCLTQTENTIAFPVRLKELNFFADIFDQEGEFEHTLVMKKMTATVIAGDSVFKRNGKIWCVGREFVCQRFISTRLENKVTHTGVIFNPEYNLISEEIAPGVFYYTNNSEENVLKLLEKRYFNHVDRASMERLESAASQREYLFGRIAIKDAVRKYIAAEDEDYLYPIEIFCDHDEKGKPFVYGEREVSERVKPIHVSLSHKDQEAVAIAADAPVGIDLEKIEEKAQSFVDVALTKKEQALLREEHRHEDVVRFWVAKEACAKKNGNGLKYKPKEYEVTAVDGDLLTVGTQTVQTLRVGEEYIAGWTI
jgi:phosphopantetheinyl transferase/malonyl CoA-acyl carrier protein transacylase